MEQKLKQQIAWLESLDTGLAKDANFNMLMLKIIEDRKYFQHERLVHLLVTLGIAIVMMLALTLFITTENLLIGLLFLVFMILECVYVVHYYRLENGVQILWELKQRLLNLLCH